MFKEQIEHVQKSAFSMVNKALENADALSTTDPLIVGWALKTRSPQKRMTADQRQYLIDKFIEGERTGNKHDPSDVAKAMRRARNNSKNPRFLPGDYLKTFQIKQYFSRLSSDKKKGKMPRMDSSETADPTETTLVPHDSAELADETEDPFEIPEFPTSDDPGVNYYLEEILLEEDSIFD